jgi:hypothetical protein
MIARWCPCNHAAWASANSGMLFSSISRFFLQIAIFWLNFDDFCNVFSTLYFIDGKSPSLNYSFCEYIVLKNVI